ncbi:MAG: phosphatidate cytidylyltransferase [Planctomycetes bacterium]|nr:phosphatidate cytidylyltransferase [Planctomycetota bacterium]
MLIPRLFIGSLLIAALLGLLYADERLAGSAAAWLPEGRVPPGALLFAACLVLILPLLSRELSRLLRAVNPEAPSDAMTCGIALLAFATASAQAFHWDLLYAVAGGLLLLTLLPALEPLLRRRYFESLTRIGYWVLISVWIGWLPACWIAARATLPAWALAWAVLAIKSGDIGAYFTGILVGRHRLATWVSPKKSIEGLIGGIALGAAVGAWLAHALELPLPCGILFGALGAFVGMLGDLAESLLKREANFKDSGRSIPGMGGIFDVMDSLLPTAPLVVWLLSKPR